MTRNSEEYNRQAKRNAPLLLENNVAGNSGVHLEQKIITRKKKKKKTHNYNCMENKEFKNCKNFH